ncbi:MAG: septum formation initiator family protein [Candidatus Eisenbacteria bacterium]|nr:septum formation initiator family protein [Candidatus Eisenbacteria bacterium]
MSTAERIASRKLYRYRKPTYPGQSRARRLIIIFLVLWVGYIFIGGRHGIIKIITLHREKARLEKREAELRGKLKELELQSKLMQKDPFYIEKVAREDFGLAKKGEIIYRMQNSK